MKETIKFKGVDPYSDQWKYWSPDDPNDLELAQDFWSTCKDICEFICLKDKNNVEMYEGSVFTHDGSTGELFGDDLGTRSYKGEFIYIVKTAAGFLGRHISYLECKNHAKFVTNSYKGWAPISNYDLWNNQKSFEVVGDIFQPEYFKYRI